MYVEMPDPETALTRTLWYVQCDFMKRSRTGNRKVRRTIIRSVLNVSPTEFYRTTTHKVWPYIERNQVPGLCTGIQWELHGCPARTGIVLYFLLMRHTHTCWIVAYNIAA